MTKTALITGITGQAGSYLAEFLLAKGYEVWGIVRRSSNLNTQRIDHVFDQLRLEFGDLTDRASIRRVFDLCQPDEIYNLGAQSHVRVSFDMPDYTRSSIVGGTLNMMMAMREVVPHARFYQASSSEMFGKSPGPQNEQTVFRPCSPYALAKEAAHEAIERFRFDGFFACNGILFNHESPRRGETFVTRKITKAAARIGAGLQDKLYLGNLDAMRDWGFAGDYVEAMWMMLQRDEPDDFVIGTGESHSVQEWLSTVFDLAGLRIEDHVEFDPRLLRASEVDFLQADADKARDVLGWEPTVRFEELAAMMFTADQEALCLTCGH